MGLIERSGLTVAVCDFYRCEKSYPLSTGSPSVSGWHRRGGFWSGVLMCPTHSPTPHWPGTQRRGTSLFVVCGCGNDIGINPANGVAARNIWHAHLARIGAA